MKGSLNLFNHRTNVNVNNRIVCYDIKELGKQMKKLGIHPCQYEDTDSYVITKTFVNNRQHFLNQLLNEET